MTPDVFNAINTMNKGLFAGLPAVTIIGMANAYLDFAPIMQDQLLLAIKDLFIQAGNHCFNDVFKIFAFQDIYKYFKAGPGVFGLPEVRKIFGKGATMRTRGTPDFPLFVYKAVNDDISPIGDTVALFEKFCA